MDIRNFWRHVEKKTPEEFVAYQTAVFGAPVTTGHDCRNALSAAHELLAAVTISGNVVILGARIEQLNKVYGSQLLVSAEVLRGAGQRHFTSPSRESAVSAPGGAARSPTCTRTQGRAGRPAGGTPRASA